MPPTPDRETLAGAEIELMNLAGPHRARDDVPVPQNSRPHNFFSEGGYYRQHHSAREDRGRVAEGTQRPHGGQHQEPGAVEFAADLVDEVAGR